MAAKVPDFRLVDADRQTFHANVGFDEEFGEVRFGGDSREADVLHSQYVTQLLEAGLRSLQIAAPAVLFDVRRQLRQVGLGWVDRTANRASAALLGPQGNDQLIESQRRPAGRHSDGTAEVVHEIPRSAAEARFAVRSTQPRPTWRSCRRTSNKTAGAAIWRLR